MGFLHPSRQTNIGHSISYRGSRIKSALVINIAIISNRSIGKKEYEKLENQRMKKEIKKMQKVKAKVIPMIIGASGTVPLNSRCGFSRFQK